MYSLYFVLIFFPKLFFFSPYLRYFGNSLIYVQVFFPFFCSLLQASKALKRPLPKYIASRIEITLD